MRLLRVPAAALAAVLAAVACLGDDPLGPGPREPVRLRMQAAVAGAANAAGERTVEIGVFYRRTGGQAVGLPARPERVTLAAGSTVQQAVTVEVAGCLADASRLPAGAPGCRLGVTLRLLDDAGAVTDSVVKESEGAPATPGSTVDMGPVTVGRTVATVAVSPAAVTLAPGESRSLTAMASDAGGAAIPGAVVTWTASDPAVVQLSATTGATVTASALGAGAATVTASSGGKSSAPVAFTVEPHPPLAITQAPAPGCVLVGQTVTLSAAGAPGPVSWLSGFTTVATVDPATGVVTGRQLGTARIFATSGAGAAQRTGDFTVCVSGPLGGVPATLDVAAGATATLAPSGADGATLSYATNDAAVATVSSAGVVTGVRAGRATITTTLTGASGSTSLQTAVTVTSTAPPEVSVAFTVPGRIRAGVVRTHVFSAAVTSPTPIRTIAIVPTTGGPTPGGCATTGLGTGTASLDCSVDVFPSQGVYEYEARATADGGGSGSIAAAVVVDPPGLAVSLEAPAAATVGVAGSYRFRATASGEAPIRGLTIRALDGGPTPTSCVPPNTGGTTATTECFVSSFPTAGVFRYDAVATSDGGGTAAAASQSVTVTHPPVLQQVMAGGTHACALSDAGAAYCWGNGSVGRLGDGTSTLRVRPTAVAGGQSFTQLAAGERHTCGVATSGAAYCWGDNAAGQLGTGTAGGNATTPVLVAGGLSFARLALGDSHTCGITTAGAAYCWGLNASGQLGTGGGASAAAPAAVAGGHTFTSVAASGHTSCGLTSGGAAFCWGSNAGGQVGDGGGGTTRPSPSAVAGGLSFASITVGAGHACGLTSAGAAHCWGTGGNGQLGDGATTDRAVPTPVTGAVAFAGLAAGGQHTCGFTAGGGARCWGMNLFGQVGVNDGTTHVKTTPQVVAGGFAFTAVTAGTNFSCGATTTGLVCWGANAQGQLGEGTTGNRTMPTPVAAP